MDKVLTIDHKSISAFRRLLYTFVVFSVVAITFYVIVLFQTRSWQSLIQPVLILFGFGMAPFIMISLRRGQVNLAGTIMIIALAIANAGNEIAWKGLTIYHAAGGCLIILLSGSLILPRQWRIWCSIAVLYLVGILLINRFEPLPRVDQNTSPLLLPFVIGTSLLLNLALLFQLLLVLPFHSIRTRLIGTFLLLVVVPVALTGTVAMVINAQNAQAAVQRQLESVASLKESAVRSWLTNLQSDLETIASGSISKDLVEQLKSGVNLEVNVDPGAVDQMRGNIIDHLKKTGFYSEVIIADQAGVIIFSTNVANQGKSVKGEAFFPAGLEESVLLPPITKEGQANVMYVARPVKTENGETVAVLAGKVNLELLNQIMTERVGLGSTGETYLVNRSHHLVTDSLFEGYKAGVSYVFSFGIDQALYQNLNGSGNYAGYRVKNVLGVYRWMPELGVALIAEQERSEALHSTVQGIFINVGLMVIAVLAALGIGYIATNQITAPLARLAKIAEQIASGNLQMEAETEHLDEIGALSNSFNSMTTQLRSMVSGLEKRVAERTRDLERRSKQLQIAAEVAREATTVHELKELLSRGVNLIHDRFGYYHAAIYLIDDLGEYAVLMAATGEAGRIMLARGHRLKVGEIGVTPNQPVVSYVAQSGRPRVTMDISADPAYYPNSLLPEAKSEAALPLKVGSKVIGVMDVQSLDTGTYDEETTSVLQIVSDQLAIAIQNTRLIEEMARSVNELQRMYGAYTQASWKSYQQYKADQETTRGRGYRYRSLEIEPVVGEVPLINEAIQLGRPVFQEEVDQSGIQGDNETIRNSILAVPIKVREQTIGAIEVQFSGLSVTNEIMSTYEEIASRLALILENARLLQDAQGLARREQQINLLSSRIRSSINLDTILQNTVRELGKAFDSTRTFIHIGVKTKDSEDNAVGDALNDGDYRVKKEEGTL